MLTKLVQRKLFRLSAVQCSGGMRRSAEGEALSQPTRFTKFKAYLKKEANLLSTIMVTQSTVTANLPIISWKASKTLSLSDVAGHGSFILLACSYLVTDFFQLRMFAASGVTLSIIFQYYRERPLWIPIRWNSLFLLINAVMIVLLLKEENDAHNIPAEKKAMYDGFARKGMNPVDFMLLISAAKRIDVKKGDVVVAEHLKNTRVFLVKRGTLSVIKNGSKIRTVMPSQFTGEMSFLRWEDRMDTTAYVKKHSKTLKKWANKDDEMELFLPLLIICERLAKRWGLSSAPVDAAVADAGAPSEVVQQLSAPDEHSTEDATYGFNVDSFGNVISEEQGSSADDPSVEPEVPEQTVFGRYLSASYNFIGGLFSSEQAAAEEAPQVEANSEGELAAATVVAEEDCVLYYWSFKRLRVLLDQHPSLGRAFERVLSDDLNRKMVNTMHVEPLQRYQLLLAAATMDGEPAESSKATLAAFRQQHKLTLDDHALALQKLGWTPLDFESGYKGAPPLSVQQQYQKLLNAALADTHDVALTDEKRTELRLFRAKHGVSSNAHLAALRKIDWTVDEFEIGSKNPTLASQKEYRAVAASERTLRWGRVRSALFSYIFPESSNQGQAGAAVVDNISALVPLDSKP